MSGAAIKPSDLELQVLSVLWDHGPRTVREILERIPDGKERAYTTVLTILQGMSRKGLVTHTQEGAAHVYLGPNNATDLWQIKKVNPQSMVHLTEKPVELAVRAMQYSSRPGENVLDLFGGSGSTLIACEQTSRKAFLMELDPPYCDVIVKRWQDFSGKQATRQNDGVAFNDLAQTGNVATVVSAGGVDVQGGPAGGTDLNAKPAVRKVAALAIEPVA